MWLARPPLSISSRFALFTTVGIAFTNAVPPPAMIPSSTAAFVALSASSILSFRSLSSVSVAAPTFITATPPDSFASLSCAFSLSKSLSAFSIVFLIREILLSISCLFPPPFTITVLSFVALIVPAVPSCSRLHP